MAGAFQFANGFLTAKSGAGRAGPKAVANGGVFNMPDGQSVRSTLAAALHLDHQAAVIA